jgi:imidazole glycerol-phosphate synthase subunit HisH
VIAVIDYGVGNVKSILNMLRRIGVDARPVSDSQSIRAADHLILPGVGAFDAAMTLLNESGLRPALEDSFSSGKPILGICLGMQLLGRGSEEGVKPGLGWIAASTERLLLAVDAPLPHMGWSFVDPKADSVLFAGEDSPRYYFLHSFAVRCDDRSDAAATAEYGGVEFTCSVQRDHVFGVQFHPEKSHRYGMRLLQRFARSAT